MTFTWSGCSLQISHKMRTRFAIFSSICTIAYKLCQICWGNKRISLVISLCLSGCFGQFAEQVHNEDHSWYIRFHMHPTSTPAHLFTIRARWKRRKFLKIVLGMRWHTTFKHFQICWDDNRISSVISLWRSRDFRTTYTPRAKWGADIVSQDLHIPLPSNFVRLVGKNFINNVGMTVTQTGKTLIQFTNQM